jgi:hypothetical protein
MMLRKSAALLVVFAASVWGQVWGQTSAAPAPAPRQSVMATSNAEALAAASRAKAAANKNLQDMGATLTKMRALLKQMSGKSSTAKDPMTKANVEMWTLMVEQLDKQYEQLLVAARQREDLEMRRASLYRQANEKVAEENRKEQAARAAAAASHAASQAPATTGAAQAPATTPASTASPN